MSDVEKFYERVRAYFPGAPEWHQLSPMEQHQIVHGINLILGVVS